MTENLNIEDNTLELILKALNRARNIKEAAKLLGITEKTLYTKIGECKIKQIWTVIK